MFPTIRSAAIVGFVTLAGLTSSGCMDQYHPEPYWAQFNQEREIAARPLARLTEAGELPAAGGEQVPIDKRYADLCASCHGAAGGGDGPAGVALEPKPRNFADAAWQASVDDARIATVIKNGGPAVGLSPLMAPWGSVLSDAEVTAMVAHVRQFKK